MTDKISQRDKAYFRRRFVNRVFAQLSRFFDREAASNGATKRMIALKLGIDPSQVTRWLSHPSNLTLESISDILLALEAEADPPRIVRLIVPVEPTEAALEAISDEVPF